MIVHFYASSDDSNYFYASNKILDFELYIKLKSRFKGQVASLVHCMGHAPIKKGKISFS
jgi:hypothetical protein